jgi:hypothetical protein
MATGIFRLRNQLLGLITKAWSGSLKTNFVEYLVVAGGGGGGAQNVGNGGGGGAGGLLQGTIPITTGSSITVTVGAGGAGGSSNGSDSVFGSITTTGGGLGGTWPGGNASAGGSGGGTGQNGTTSALGVTGQGNNGGNGGLFSPGNGAYSGSGGGGAGSAGVPAWFGTTSSPNNATFGGRGGTGIGSSINGTLTVYAGGGGGSSHALATEQTNFGGAGGGGNGKYGASTGATAGTANTGGGGGGAGENVGSVQAGGSGIVIVSYPDTYAAATSTTGSPTVSTSGSGSFYFNGSSYANYASFAPTLNTSTTWTVEGWFNITSFGSTFPIVSFAIPGNLNTIMQIPPDGSVYYGIGGGSTISSSPGLVTTGVWYHIAYVRNGSNLNVYLNGTSVLSTGSAATYSQDAVNFVVGFSYLYYANGYISNLRYVNTAVYTANFTAPTAPLSAISGTQILLSTVSPNQYNDSSTNAYKATVTGTPTWNQLSPFTTGLGYKNRVYTWTGSGSITF